MFKEVQQLLKLIREHRLSVQATGNVRDDLLEIIFRAGQKHWRLYIEDEYKDFKEVNQALSVFLTLRSLENYYFNQDITRWCGYFGIDQTDAYWINYHDELGKAYLEIEEIIGKPTPFISDMDYDMQEGAMDELLRLIE